MVGESTIDVSSKLKETFMTTQTLLANWLNTYAKEHIKVRTYLRYQSIIASHIKPWAVSDPKTERTNPCNGLALNTLHHDAYDRGIFTIDTDYRIWVSKTAKENYTSEVFDDFFGRYEGKVIKLPERFLPSKEMIEYHNSKLVNF